MKRLLAVMLILLLVFGMTLTGCGGQSAPEQEEESAPLIGISLPAADHGWVAAVSYYAEKTAQELGMNYKLVTSSDPNQQASQIEELISMECAAIVLFPHNNELTVAAQKILDAGIPLINFDRKVDVDATCYLAGDNPGIGANGAEYIAEKLGGKGNVVIAHVPAYGSIDVERVDAFKEVIAEKYPDIKIIGDYGAPSSSKEDGLKMMTDILTANPQIDAVYSMDDELSMGLFQAITEAKRTDIKAITGGGGAQDYFDLMQTTDVNLASALYSPSMISECVKIANDLVNNGVTPEKEIIIPATIVDKANVADYLDADSPY